MSKVLVADRAFCGIDVSKSTLAVAMQQAALPGFERREFANSAAGHRQLIGWLR